MPSTARGSDTAVHIRYTRPGLPPEGDVPRHLRDAPRHRLLRQPGGFEGSDYPPGCERKASALDQPTVRQVFRNRRGSDHLTRNDLEAERPDGREGPSGPLCCADRDPGAPTDKTVVVHLRAVAAAHELIVHLGPHLGIDDGFVAALLPSPY